MNDLYLHLEANYIYFMALILAFAAITYLVAEVSRVKSELTLMEIAKDGFFGDFCKAQNDMRFYEQESIELNQSYKQYMTSVEAMVRQHAADLGEAIDALKESRNTITKMRKAMHDWGINTNDADFSPESKIKTVLEQ